MNGRKKPFIAFSLLFLTLLSGIHSCSPGKDNEKDSEKDGKIEKKDRITDLKGRVTTLRKRIEELREEEATEDQEAWTEKLNRLDSLLDEHSENLEKEEEKADPMAIASIDRTLQRVAITLQSMKRKEEEGIRGH